MKKTLAILLATVLLVTGLPLAASASYQYGTNLIVNGDMEGSISAPLVANETDPPNVQSATLTQVAKEPLMEANRVLLAANRNSVDNNSGANYDLTSILKTKDENGDYKYANTKGRLYVSAKIRLKNSGETAYVKPKLYYWKTGGGSQMLLGEPTKEYAVTSEGWTDVGLRNTANYYNFDGELLVDTLLDNPSTIIKLMFSVTSTSQGSTAYLGDYYIDDVSFFFVAGATGATLVTRQPSLLENSSFEELSNGQPIDYSATNEDSWNGTATWFGNLSTISVQTLMETVAGGAPVEPAGVHSGSFGLKVTNRPWTQQGLALNMKPLLSGLATQQGEAWHMSFYIKMVTPGATMTISPIWGGSGANAYLNGDAGIDILVTDEWTLIGYNSTTSSYYAFRREGETPEAFNPDGGGWSSIRFKTSTTADYYIDDVKVWKSGPSGAGAVETEIAELPSVANIMPSDRAAIEAARINYDSLSSGDKALVTNYALLLAAEAELAKFDTRMTLSGGLVMRSGFAVAQPGQTTAAVLGKLTAANGSIGILDGSLPAETAANTATGMQAVLAYKGVPLQSVYFAVLGDLDGDGLCSVNDMVTIKKVIVDSGYSMTAIQSVCADFDGVAGTNASELTAVKRYMLGLEDSLYIPTNEEPG